MTARILSLDELDVAVSLLAAGAIVGVPTDTVYGIAARLGDADAVASLFSAKGRPSNVPIAVLCATTEQAASIATRWPPAAARLAAAYWPGPLTVVVDADASLAATLGAGGAVGLRVPDDALCRSLLSASGPLAVTSANAHGAPPATTALAVATGLGAAVVAVLDGGKRDGAVSTVLDVTGDEPVVVRDGALDAAAVLAVLREA